MGRVLTRDGSHSLMDFFRFYAREFLYNVSVASIRAGLLTKESKGWDNDVSLSDHVVEADGNLNNRKARPRNCKGEESPMYRGMLLFPD